MKPYYINKQVYPSYIAYLFHTWNQTHRHNTLSRFLVSEHCFIKDGTTTFDLCRLIGSNILCTFLRFSEITTKKNRKWNSFLSIFSTMLEFCKIIYLTKRCCTGNIWENIILNIYRSTFEIDKFIEK